MLCSGQMARGEGIESRVDELLWRDLQGTSFSVAGVTITSVANLQGSYTCLNVNPGLIYANRALRVIWERPWTYIDIW